MTFQIKAAQRIEPRKAGKTRFITEAELRAIAEKVCAESGLTAAEVLAQ